MSGEDDSEDQVQMEETLELDQTFAVFSKPLLQKMRENGLLSPTEIQRLRYLLFFRQMMCS